MKKIQVADSENTKRLDVFLSENADGLSRGAAVKMIESGGVFINDTVQQKKNYRCSTGEIIGYQTPCVIKTGLIAQDIAIEIVYEDDCVAVINKPRGMVVHPAAGNPDKTLVNAIMFHCGDSLSGIGGELRPGIVHRIDKDTSGLLIIAKNDEAHASLSAQLKDRSLSRVYEAVVHGTLSEEMGKIDAPISRHPKDRKKMAIVKDGRNAVTHYRLLTQYERFAHVECKLETGRTHQIRIHMSAIGHPIVGDSLYGAGKNPFELVGQCLHAKKLRFVHPKSGKNIEVESDLPEYFLKIINKLNSGV